MHTQYSKYTLDDNNTHNYNNTHKKTTTIRTRQLTTIHTRKLTKIRTRHLKTHVQKVNNTKVRKYCVQFLVFFPTHELLMKLQYRHNFNSVHTFLHMSFEITFLHKKEGENIKA